MGWNGAGARWGGGTMQPETLAPDYVGITPAEIILRNFAAAIGRKRYEHWFHDKTTFHTQGDILIVAVANPFLLSWLPQSFRNSLTLAAKPILGPSATVRFQVSDEFLESEQVDQEEVNFVAVQGGGAQSPHFSSTENSIEEGSRSGRGKTRSKQETAPKEIIGERSRSEPHSSSSAARKRDVSSQSETARRTDLARSPDRTRKSGSYSPSVFQSTESCENVSLKEAMLNEAMTIADVVAPEMSKVESSARDQRGRERTKSQFPQTDKPSSSGKSTSKSKESPRTSPESLSRSSMSKLSSSVDFAIANGGSVSVDEPATLGSLLNRSTRVSRTAPTSREITSTTHSTMPSAVSTKASSPTSLKATTVNSSKLTVVTEKGTIANSKAASRPQPSVGRRDSDDSGNKNVRRYAELGEFVAGSCNEFALSAAIEVCNAPGAQFASLFIHGPVGVGKTHLLEGICRQFKQRYPQKQAVYLTAEAFANFFTQALREHKLPSFRQKFRNVDVLIVDDIDFLDGKRGIQEEFLFTLQHLEAHGKVVIASAHGHPRLLTKICDELQTRFLSGMVCRVETPDTEMRRTFIRSKLKQQSSDLLPDVINYLADRFKSSIRELDGALKTLLAYQRLQGKRLAVSAARQVLADLERDCIRVVRLGDIESAVCNLFGVTPDDLKSAKRQKSLTQPRMLAMFLARKHTQSAYKEIGQYFGNRNHSTVMNAEKKIKTGLDDNTPIQIQSQSWRLAELVDALEEQLRAG